MLYLPEKSLIKTSATIRFNPVWFYTDMIKILWTLLRNRRELIVETDIIFVNNLRSISRDLTFTTIQKIVFRNQFHLELVLKKKTSINYSKIFTINHVLVDREFEYLQEFCSILNIHLDNTSANEYITSVEKIIRVIKEHFHRIRHILLLKALPTCVQIKLVHFAVF